MVVLVFVLFRMGRIRILPMLWLTGDRVLGESSAGEPDKENRKSSIWMGSQETITWGTGGSDQRLMVRLVAALQKNASAVKRICSHWKWRRDGVYCNKSLDLIAQRTKWIIYKTISSLLLLLWLSSTAHRRCKHTGWEFGASQECYNRVHMQVYELEIKHVPVSFLKRNSKKSPTCFCPNAC